MIHYFQYINVKDPRFSWFASVNLRDEKLLAAFARAAERLRGPCAASGVGLLHYVSSAEVGDRQQGGEHGHLFLPEVH